MSSNPANFPSIAFNKDFKKIRIKKREANHNKLIKKQRQQIKKR